MAEPRATTPAAFYDDLAASYDRMFPDWDASSRRQGDVLDALVAGCLGPGPRSILDCAVGIGTQLIGLAAHGHAMVGSDVSAVAVRRALQECRRRGVRAGLAPADMRALPFADGAFDAVVCADNALPHLLTAGDVVTALGEMRRVTRPGGLVLVTTRDYDTLRAERPATAPLQLSRAAGEVTVTFQLWEWWPDGERYDLRHFQVTGQVTGEVTGEAAGEDERWRVDQRRTVYWALTRAELSGFARRAGLGALEWRPPDETGFFQPVLLARVPARDPSSG